MVLYGCEIDASKVVCFDNTQNKKSHDQKRVNYSKNKSEEYIGVDEKEMKRNIREVFGFFSRFFIYFIIEVLLYFIRCSILVLTHNNDYYTYTQIISCQANNGSTFFFLLFFFNLFILSPPGGKKINKYKFLLRLVHLRFILLS